jgi:hypothetical protein
LTRLATLTVYFVGGPFRGHSRRFDQAPAWRSECPVFGTFHGDMTFTQSESKKLAGVNTDETEGDRRSMFDLRIRDRLIPDKSQRGRNATLDGQLKSPQERPIFTRRYRH